jgi:hypothetical protein
MSGEADLPVSKLIVKVDKVLHDACRKLAKKDSRTLRAWVTLELQKIVAQRINEVEE